MIARTSSRRLFLLLWCLALPSSLAANIENGGNFPAKGFEPQADHSRDISDRSVLGNSRGGALDKVQGLIRKSEKRLDERHAKLVHEVREEQVVLSEAVSGLQQTVEEASTSERRLLRQGKIANFNKRLTAVQTSANQTAQELDALDARVDALETRVNRLLRSIESRLSAVETGLDEVTRLVSPDGSTYHCGCLECGDSVWNSQAPAGAGSQFTCGSRIQYLEGQGMSHLDACRQIAGTEHPTECSICNPDSCAGAGPFIRTPAPSPTPPLEPSTALYCFPDYNSRTRWTGVWGQYQVEVKQDPAGGACGPGNNIFTPNTVSLANGNELTMQYKMVGTTWEASEVRVLLPQNLMPYMYGTYKFSVKSVSTIDSSTGQVLSPNLSEDLVLGLFTWDDTEDYISHENYNHEVDIEISRWGDPDNADGQFVVQPPQDPHYHRFFTGAGNTYNPGGKTYEFTWNPTSISWSSSGGQSHSYTTQQALDRSLPDFIQCLPANMEVRINIWNKNGAVAPAGMADTHVAQVVIDNFTFTPSYADSVANGETCSKDCQCLAPSRCVNNKCAAS